MTLYRVVIWEILTVEDPYKDINPVEVAVQVMRDGLRLEMPKYAPSLIQSLVQCMMSLRVNTSD